MSVIDRIVALKEGGDDFTWAGIGAAVGMSGQAARGLYRRHRRSQNPSLEELAGTTPYVPPPPRVRSHPKGWEPGMVLENGRGTVSTFAPPNESPNWDYVLGELGFDPKLFTILEPVNVRTWDANMGGGETKRFFYYKANVIQRRDDRPDVEELIREIREHDAAPTISFSTDTEYAFVTTVTDWQLGSRDGDGTKGIVERVLESTDEEVQRIHELRYLGCQLQTLYMACLGDLIEGVDGQYASQTYEVSLNRREQVKVARRLLLHKITTLAPMFERVIVAGLPGNHGEFRRNGKLFTQPGDNDDVAVVEQVAEIVAMNPDAYGHVGFVIPDNELDITLDVAGTTTTFAHGHQFRSGDAMGWWKNQAHGMQPAGDSLILVSGHLHHLKVQQDGARTWFQCPSMMSEAEFFRNSSGLVAAPGVLTFVVGPEGWSDLSILR